MQQLPISFERGFSLVEIMVSVAIVAVMLATGIPAMTSFVAESRLSAQADQLAAMLNQARISAIKERRQFTVCPAVNAETDTACSNSVANWSTGLLISNGTSIVRRASVPSTVTVTSAATAVNFRGTIGSATAATSFTVCASGIRQQQVDISIAGHASKRINTNVCP